MNPTIDGTGEPLFEPMATDDDRLWGALIHLTVLLPVLSFVPLLVIWLMKREQSPFVDDHGREALSFQISFFLWQCVAGVFSIVLIGLPFAILLPLLALIMGVINAIKAGQGCYVRYPMTIRFFD